jgi:hypothetical protein
MHNHLGLSVLIFRLIFLFLFFFRHWSLMYSYSWLPECGFAPSEPISTCSTRRPPCSGGARLFFDYFSPAADMFDPAPLRPTAVTLY